MSDIANFVLGLITGISAMVMLILMWALMNISGQISREEKEEGWVLDESQEWRLVTKPEEEDD